MSRYIVFCIVLTRLHVKSDQLGAVKTVMLAKARIDPDVPLLVFDGGHVLQWPKGSLCAERSNPLPSSFVSGAPEQSGVGTLLQALVSNNADALVTVHEDSDPRYSYAHVEVGTDKVVAVGDKVPVTNLACNGIYLFRNGSMFESAALSLFSKNETVRGQFYLHRVVHHILQPPMNGYVIAQRVPKVWSVRTISEIADFQQEYVPPMAHQRLHVVYDEMLNRQRRLLQNGTVGDPLLVGKDTRRCLAAYQICEPNCWQCTSAFQDLCVKVRGILKSEHVLYGEPSSGFGLLDGALHFTFMQLIGFDVYDRTRVPIDYCEVVQALLVNRLPKFECRFDSLAVTPNSIFVYGNASCDVNHVRDAVRRELSRIGYPLLEPYKSDMVHMTLVRFTKSLDQSQLKELLAIEQESRGKVLGVLTSSHISVSEASWKMQQNELPQKRAVADLI